MPRPGPGSAWKYARGDLGVWVRRRPVSQGCPPNQGETLKLNIIPLSWCSAMWQ
jgi:hypothetical protein